MRLVYALAILVSLLLVALVIGAAGYVVSIPNHPCDSAADRSAHQQAPCPATMP